MIGKIIGAAAGAAAGNATRGMTGAKGALIGTVAVAAARRMGVMGLVAAGAGGYLIKKVSDRKEERRAVLSPTKPMQPVPPEV